MEVEWIYLRTMDHPDTTLPILPTTSGLDAMRLLARLREVAGPSERARDVDWQDVLAFAAKSLNQLGIPGAQFCYCESTVDDTVGLGTGSESLRYLLQLDGKLYTIDEEVDRDAIELLTQEEAWAWSGQKVVARATRWLEGDEACLGVATVDEPLAGQIFSYLLDEVADNLKDGQAWFAEGSKHLLGRL